MHRDNQMDASYQALARQSPNKPFYWLIPTSLLWVKFKVPTLYGSYASAREEKQCLYVGTTLIAFS